MILYLRMLQLMFLFSSYLPETKTETFTIGYITGSQRLQGDIKYPRPGLTISGAISLAVEEVNRGPLAERGHKLDFIVSETYGQERISVQKTADLWTKNVSVYVGPQETCEHEAIMAAAFNVPMISYYCTHSATSDKSKFPTFARTRPPDTQISKSVASVLTAFNWTHVVLLYLNSPDFEFGDIATIVVSTLSSAGISVMTRYWDTPYSHGYIKNPFYNLVEETYRDTRIFVILGHYDEHLGLMVAMEEKKLFDKGEYFVVGVDIEQYDSANPTKYLRGLLQNNVDLVAQKAYQSYLGVVSSSPVGFENFTSLVNYYMERPPFEFPNPLIELGGVKRVNIKKILQIRAEAAYLYDAVHLYAKALMKILDEGENPRNGTAIINSMKRMHYKSAMGYIVYMDENGDAEGNYTLIARKLLKNSTADYGLFPVGIFTLRRCDSRLPVLHMTDTVDWIAGRPPTAVPICGFKGEKCITHTLEITSGFAGGTFFVIIIISLIFYRNWKYEQELDSLLWKVDFKDIQINEEANSNSKMTRSTHPLIRTSQVSLSSNPDADFRYSNIFTQIGIYKGRVFAIKKVHKKSIDITREMKKELKMMKDLRHDNLNAFIGACTDPPNICIVTEYCTRGSLKDILENEDVKLDNMFVASLVGDILRGMIYLHESPVRFHGALHTANCLVDSRWVVKLSDFGLREFKKGAEIPTPKGTSTIVDNFHALLYKAPELLRVHNPLSKGEPWGTQKGDVYSFGIILYELHSRHGPYGNTKMTCTDILNNVIFCENPSFPFRPPMECLENSFDFVRECLKECWAENPDERPDFKGIRTKLRPLRKGMKPNIFDNMMAMMEKYANNLEVLVDERTDQLQEEKKKTDALLYEMLPKPVADQLKKGNKVEAESFDCVTIYFSDIVGFTAMSAESTPLQVVDFLNDLYTCFDSIIENYDVYKVETIGDAYMVVSGCPIKNKKNDQHAGEIASMSLHLLSKVNNFKIRHRPDDQLKLRIGIHSGPVCAGVVGLKMPRFCLFGDTVNTASRMESTGIHALLYEMLPKSVADQLKKGNKVKAGSFDCDTIYFSDIIGFAAMSAETLKIHCSWTCKELLTKIGGYHLLERGIVAMKGKGEQQTYWLVGEDPQRKQDRERKKIEADGRNIKTTQLDSNGQSVMTRSSLKNKNSIIRSPLPRCSSFESPKRLRFASGDKLEKKNALALDVIADSSPHKKSANSLTETIRESDSCDPWRSSSTSCPCIENLATSAAAVAQSQLRVLSRRSSHRSVPALCACAPSSGGETIFSAPPSPGLEEGVYCMDCTPLLRVTQPQDPETSL